MGFGSRGVEVLGGGLRVLEVVAGRSPTLGSGGAGIEFEVVVSRAMSVGYSSPSMMELYVS